MTSNNELSSNPAPPMDDLVEQKVAQTQPIVDQPTAEEHGLGLNDTEHIADQAGVEIPDEVPLDVKGTLEERDEHRWQLDPDSAQL
ncbi:MAG: DUF6335 family protein [Microcoleaceae cyanobacterium]